ncbi:Caspase domain protein [Planktothrix sp. PCC 11201]|nr:Caspase domain protein [Planktothrix sp. PCC 11201]
MFLRFEPDKKNETLYCYDSSEPGKWHLADKELAKLISEVAVKNPHICVILDCCHSGGGVKDPSLEVVERRAADDDRPRPLESYIFSAKELESLRSGSKKWELPQGRNILMAACEPHDTAKELTIGDEKQKRGIFTYSLLKALERPGKLTYRELWQETKNTVSIELKKISSSQCPQLEVTPPDHGNLLFLDGAIAERPSYFTVRHDNKLGWVIDGGGVHGVQPPAGEETTVLALFDFNCNVNDFKDPNKSIGQAKVTKVLPQLSQLEIISNSKNLSTGSIYKAITIAVPLPAQGVYIEGDATGVKLASQAIQSATMGNRPSAYIRKVENRDQAQLYLQCRNQEYSIQVKGDNRPLVAPIQGFTLDNAKLAIERLEHIARWLTIRELPSPPASRIQPNDIEMELLFEGENTSPIEKEIRREYKKPQNGTPQPPKCTIKLTNNSHKTLYCTILCFTDRFAIVAPFFEAGYVRLEPGQWAWAADGDYIKWSIDPELMQLGIRETKDVLKLIVSKSEFDARLSLQDALDQPRCLYRGLFKQSPLNRLMNRAQTRSPQVSSSETYDDWYTQQVILTSVLPT